jgi:hypothetical protein
MSDTVAVKVRCFNRRSKEIFDRWYFTALSALQPNEQQVIRELTTRTPSVSQFLAARRLMNVYPQDDMAAIPIGTSFACVTLPDYFEDELGQPMDPVDLISAMTGAQDPIILNDERSVLRLGPQGLRDSEQIDAKAANTLAHFLQLVEVIATSRWVKTETKAGGLGPIGADNALAEFRCPPLSDTYAILLPLRQLFLDDGSGAFLLACNSYSRYALDERKRFWITALRKQCLSYMDSQPWPPLVRDCSVKSLLRDLMYGAGMVHFHDSDHEARLHFRDLVQKHSRERVVFSFVVASQHLYAFARKAYHVIRQDYDHWRSQGCCPDPEIMLMSKLFESRPIP